MYSLPQMVFCSRMNLDFILLYLVSSFDFRSVGIGLVFLLDRMGEKIKPYTSPQAAYWPRKIARYPPGAGLFSFLTLYNSGRYCLPPLYFLRRFFLSISWVTRMASTGLLSAMYFANLSISARYDM